MEKKVFAPSELGAPPGGFSQALKVGNMLFISGQLGRDKNGRIAAGDFLAQVTQVFENLKVILRSAGAGFENVVKTNAYIIDMKANYLTYREVRAQYIMSDKPPVSTLVEVKGLAFPDALIEIEALAILD